MEYEKLPQTDLEVEEQADVQMSYRIKWTFGRMELFSYVGLLTLSLILNLLCILDRMGNFSNFTTHAVTPASVSADLSETSSYNDVISPFAEIPRDVMKPLVEHTSYHNPENWTASHELWRDMDIDYAVVALPDEFAKEKGLLTAQRFPWDHSKGVYVLHGMHNLHCLKILYLAVKEFQAQEEQSIPWEHLSHCFDSIRQQLVCDADDTPRATYAGQEGISGIGQSRKCRNWDAYRDWAQNHTACYHRANKPDFTVPAIEHYKFCPQGSGYNITR